MTNGHILKNTYTLERQDAGAARRLQQALHPAPGHAEFRATSSGIPRIPIAMSALGRHRFLISQLPMRLGLTYNTAIHRIATAGAHTYFKRLLEKRERE
jgi:hypothetical protein